MRLYLISELRFGKATEKVKALLATMPKHKRKHSIRVGKKLHKAGAGKAGVYAGLLHDYLERGGDVRRLLDHSQEFGISQQAIEAVKILSMDEKNGDSVENQPLIHMQQVLPTLADPEMRNIVILAKMADRLDNLTKRARSGKIGRNYRLKSDQLVSFLQSQYSGKQRPLLKLIRQYAEIIK